MIHNMVRKNPGIGIHIYTNGLNSPSQGLKKVIVRFFFFLKKDKYLKSNVVG